MAKVATEILGGNNTYMRENNLQKNISKKEINAMWRIIEARIFVPSGLENALRRAGIRNFISVLDFLLVSFLIKMILFN